MTDGKQHFVLISSGLYRSFWLSVLLSLCSLCAFSNPVINIVDKNQSIPINKYVYEYIDTDKVSSINDFIETKRITNVLNRTPIYQIGVKSVWYRFAAKNSTELATLYLNIAYSNLSEVSLYAKEGNQYVLLEQAGNNFYSKRKISGSPDIVFDLRISPTQQKEYIVHVNSSHPIIFPAYVSTEFSLHMFTTLQTIIIGLYLGMLSIMFLYNLFLYFSTRDKNYLLYVIYIFLLALAQVTASGYSFRYLWPTYTPVNNYAVIWTSSLSAIAGILFSMFFLQTAFYASKSHKLLWGLIGIYVVGMFANLAGFFNLSYNILNFNSLVSVIVVLVISIHISRKGFRAAYFYLIAWMALLLSFIVLILRNINVLPYNNFTAYVFYIGSSIEVALLSIALADKINALRKEKESSQAEALKASQENERLVKEQNLFLEKKVAERTAELQNTNVQLTDAYGNLKDAQIQLVEAEKMASLGQLTAGIAHEINNPINFVKSNIKPLQLDIKDLVMVIDEYEKLHATDNSAVQAQLKHIEKLKQQIDLDFVKNEIDGLMRGIEDGAERTAEIVRGLRTFSRLDESQIKIVNIHEGIESTLVILRNNIPFNIKVIKEYNANGNVECFPGKLNQVFMNILNNSIQAIKAKNTPGTEEDLLIISTQDINDNEVEIRINDSGIGMSEEVKRKIFDPFFTTKDVGEGTGLGLAIVFKIIKEHGGRITVNSTEGVGSEFVLTLFHSIPVAALT